MISSGLWTDSRKNYPVSSHAEAALLPHTSMTVTAVKYYRGILNRFEERLEAFTGATITEERLREEQKVVSRTFLAELYASTPIQWCET